MPTVNSKLLINKLLLVWSTFIPEEARASFTMIFTCINDLIDYITKDLTKTDTYHLIIPFHLLQQLLNDPIYRFPQVRHIDVIYVGLNDRKNIQRNFKDKHEKLQFWSMREVLQRLESTELDIALMSSNPRAMNAIISTIEDRLAAKRSTDFNYRSQVLKRFAPTSLHGLPVKNINDFSPHFICRSCKLVPPESYLLKCGHQLCKICLRIKKCCAMSSEGIPLDQTLEMTMRDLPTHCSGCEWIGSSQDYKVHFKENHHGLITCLIRNKKDDESLSDQQSLIDTNPNIFLDNFCSSESEITLTSLNGTCIWQISDVDDMRSIFMKEGFFPEFYFLANAASGKQRSVYSSSFYSFPNGYKLCLRFYINGDCKTRDAYMSVFFMLMRGEYDENLKWPFEFKVTFTLIDQSAADENPRHIDKFCWPNQTNMCFERPTNISMNDAYGIPKLYCLKLFEQNQNRFVKNDTMFIKVEIDLVTERPDLPLNDGAGDLSTDDEPTDASDDIDSLIMCSPDIV